MAPKPHSKFTENLISSRKSFLIYGNLRKVEYIESKRLRSKMKIVKRDSCIFIVYAAYLAVFKVGYGVIIIHFKKEDIEYFDTIPNERLNL